MPGTAALLHAGSVHSSLVSAQGIHKPGGWLPSLSYPEAGMLGLDLNPVGIPEGPMFPERLETIASSTYTDIDVRVSPADIDPPPCPPGEPTLWHLSLYPLCRPGLPPRFHRSAKKNLRAVAQVAGTPCSTPWVCQQDPEHRASLCLSICLLARW